jgi:hypothetical protein
VRPRVKYVCQSKTCRGEVETEIQVGDRQSAIPIPNCSCGSEMKKAYSTPVLSNLSKADAIRRFGDFGGAKDPIVQAR